MGSVGNKYRVHEVAKDFGVPTKQITEILTKYAETPKNHMQVLGDRELSLIFESLTQHNQVSGIQAIYADAAKPAEKKAEPARQQPAARKAETEKKPGQHSEQKLQGKRNDRNRNLDKCPDCDQRDKHRAQHKVFCFHTLQNDFLLKYMNVPAIRNIFP